jgi:dihydrofolate reductase
MTVAIDLMPRSLLQRRARIDEGAAQDRPEQREPGNADEIARLKAEPGKDIIAHGGASFAQSLVRFDLVDEYRLVVHPVVLGRGLPLFSQAEAPLVLELVELVRFPKGTAAHVYKRR